MMILLSLNRTDLIGQTVLIVSSEEKSEETLERMVKSCYHLFQMEKD